MDLAMAALVSPTMGSGRLSFVYDFPPEQAALANIRRAETPVAERFEVFLSGAELANGFHELVDAGEQRGRFAAELGRRRHLGLPAVPVDERFLAALEAGVPACSGVAVGLDRLLMCITGADHIDQVLAFGWTRI
jgi:lysyl-tRNA synthetase class 2